MSNRTPKISVIILIVLMVLAGCSSTSNIKPPFASPALAAELIFYSWEDDTPQSVLDAFTQEYGVEVTYVTYQSQEEAIENIRAGQQYDIVVMDNQLIPTMVAEGLLAEIDHRNVLNLDNISINFRDLVYDPGNRYSVPYSWGTTGLVVRDDLVLEPVTSWSDLWDPRYAGKFAIRRDINRSGISLTLKSLGYSINSEDPAELEAALARLLELRPNVVLIDSADFGRSLVRGDVVISVGWAEDVLAGRAENEMIDYVLPKEGAVLWGDNFVIPANSPNKYTSERFLDFMLRPEIGGQLTNATGYATPNKAAYPFIEPEILNDPLIFPPNEIIQESEVYLPLSPEGEKLYAEIWERFLAAE